MALNFAVDVCLLAGANRLAGFSVGWRRVLPAGALGGLYAGICLLPGFSFLGNAFWRTAALGAMGVIAYGIRRNAWRRTILFLFLSMALGGIAVGLGKRSIASLLLSAAMIFILCVFGFCGQPGKQRFTHISIPTPKGCVELTALLDTGNTLFDPITGQSVLVVDSRVANRLCGLRQKELTHPVETLTSSQLPGLRLIPYHAVGNPGGVLLAKRFENVLLGKRRTAMLIAFAPGDFSNGGAYQALLGGEL